MKLFVRNGIVFLIAVSCVCPLFAQSEGEANRDAAVERVTSEIRYLASDELGGRLPGTEGIEKAAVFIEKAFEEAGLKKLENGTYRQEFTVNRGRELNSEASKCTIKAGDKSWDLEYEKQFVPQLNRKNFEISGDLVFVGYGIKAEEHNYDEYADLDVDGKVVVLIRREPQQNDADSVFDGTEVSEYAYINTKIRAANRAGAAAVIMVNDGVEATNDEKDVLSSPNEFGQTSGRIPLFHIKRSVLDAILEAAPLAKADGSKLSKIADIEGHIDETLSPLSQAMEGCSAELKLESKSREIKTSNIIGIIEGEGPNKDEVIVIGGHYDHLGMGKFGSRKPGSNAVHNGADDNATGTVAVMELARMFGAQEKKPNRTIVFAAFSAEEMGLLGAVHYCKEPLYPLANTISMINFDMIGWLYDDRELTIYSYASCAEYEPILDAANESSKLVLKKAGPFGGSDHRPFMQRNIPVMFFHTGLTNTYHTPEDDFETLDCPGAYTVIEYTKKVLDGIDALEKRPEFVQPSTGAQRRFVRFGAFLDSDHEKGVEVIRISDDSLAAKSGFKVGDVITSAAGKKVEKRLAFSRQLKANIDKTIDVVILRDGKEMTLEVEIK